MFGYAVVKFGDIASITRGASPRPIKRYITSSEQGINWIKIGDAGINTKYITQTAERITIEGAEKSRKVKKGDFILSNSMSFGRPYILQIDGCIHDGWLSISDFEDYFVPDYLYHLLSSDSLQNEMGKKASFGGAIQNLNAEIVRSLELQIPSIDEQRRIIDLLDKFEVICNDLQSGLPAEIVKRQKQYEYYRDKLLSFKEL
ncbi:restriction endonuclease subunit S [Coprococcus sp. AF16-5]|uniref:restriction endonuclease subunit S n=1 Tax=Coprococcus sp. AF16-5 TaxID=2293088 RepID=UPI000E49BB0A|nr:restriction endonuclease subunit S [Coprococcus sp. AF16-5]RHR66375.1 restriction endonuclease subunit S [Coprococcus sp. AF16-5]